MRKRTKAPQELRQIYPTNFSTPSGAGLDFKDRGTWNTYHPRAETAVIASKFTDVIRVRLPNCGDWNLKNFEICGVDVVIGFGQYSERNKGFFVRYDRSVTIDGYNNGFKANIDSVSSGGYADIRVDLAAGNRTLYNRDMSQVTLGFDYWSIGRNDPIDMWTLQSLVRDGCEKFYRVWIRTRVNCGSDKDSSDSGFCYGGYNIFNNTTSPDRGHTFNNGIRVVVPMPLARTNDDVYMQYGDNQGKAHLKVGWCPKIAIWRAPSEGYITVASDGYFDHTGGVMTLEGTTFMATVEFTMWYLTKKQNDPNTVDGENTRTITLKGSDIGNIDWYDSDLTIGTGNWCNPPAGEGQYQMFRFTYQYKDTNPDVNADYWMDPSGLRRWQTVRLNPGAVDSNNEGWYFYTTSQAYVVNRPYAGSIFTNMITPIRRNNTLNPRTSTLKFDARITSEDYSMYQNMTKIIQNSWKIRTKAAYNYGAVNYWDKDVKDYAWCVVGQQKPADIIKALYAVYPYGADLEGFELGMEAIPYMELHGTKYGNKSTSTRPAGEGWTGYLIESPVDNVRVKDPNNLNPTHVWFTSANVVIDNHAALQIYYDSPIGYNKKRHFLTLGLFRTLDDVRHGRHFNEHFLLGSWGSGYSDQWNRRVADYSVGDQSFVDIFKTSAKGREVRGNYVNTTAIVMTEGWWEYKNWWGNSPGEAGDVNTSNDLSKLSDIYYINSYPDCYLSNVSLQRGKNSTDIKFDYHIIDRNSAEGGNTIHVTNFWANLIKHDGTVIRVLDNSGSNFKDYADWTQPMISGHMNNSDIGLKHKLVLHAYNNYPYGTTDDGSRDVNSDGSTSFEYEFEYNIDPNVTISLSTSYGEECVVSIHSACTRYFYQWLYYKRVGTDTWIKLNATQFPTINPTFTFNPTKLNLGDGLRDNKFVFRVETSVYSYTNYSPESAQFHWNDKPRLTSPGISTTQDKLIGDEWTEWAANTGNHIAGSAIYQDHNPGTIEFFYNYGNAKYVGRYDVDASSSTYHSFTADEIHTATGIYPIDLNTTVCWSFRGLDQYNIISDMVYSAGGYKLIGAINKSNYSCDAVSGYSSSDAGTVYGTQFSISFNILSDIGCQFVNTDWKYRHYIMAYEKLDNGSYGDAVYIISSYHSGMSIPNKVTMTVDASQYPYFKPGKRYVFRLYTRLCKVNGDGIDAQIEGINGRIYLSNSPIITEFSYGSKPVAPTVHYPINNSSLIMKNPPLLISVPSQNDPSNNEISEIGVDYGSGYVWSKPGNLSNYTNTTVVLEHTMDAIRPSGQITLKVAVRSKMTNMISDYTTVTINILDLYIKRDPGDSMTVKSIVDVRREMNRVMLAYGQSEGSYIPIDVGKNIMFNVLQDLVKFYNQNFLSVLSGYDGYTRSNLSITKPETTKRGPINRIVTRLTTY